jgi:hypothetical protein
MSTLEVKELSHPAGQVIKIASGKTLDLKTQGSVTMPSGSVLQVVSVEDPDQTTMTNTSYVDVGGLTASITPSNASSKILVRITPITYISYNADSYPITYVNIVRGSTVLKEKISYYYAARAPNGYIEMGTNFNMEILDSPNTTSTVTYKVQSRTSSTVNSIWRVGSTITLTEIQG